MCAVGDASQLACALTLVFGRSHRRPGWSSSALGDGPANALPLAIPTSSEELTDCARAVSGCAAIPARTAAEMSADFAGRERWARNGIDGSPRWILRISTYRRL